MPRYQHERFNRLAPLTMRRFVEFMHASSLTLRKVLNRYPAERVLVATAATILEGPDGEPVGYSFRRLRQLHGNVVITNQRAYVESSFWSPSTAVSAVLIAMFAYQLPYTEFWAWPLLGVTALLIALRKRPYSRDLPFGQVDRIQFGAVRGFAETADILTLSHQGQGVHLVLAQRLTPELKQIIINMAPHPT